MTVARASAGGRKECCVTTGHFTIESQSDQGLLRITLRGHWDLATVVRYRVVLTAAIERMRASGVRQERIVALVDARGVTAQTQAVVAFYQRHLGIADLAPRRLATLLSSALFKRQVERIAIPRQRIFADEDEAMAWLLAA
jgi:hypothetical protein